jgi:glycosyltransferase involved in cell wall biosynthesis
VRRYAACLSIGSANREFYLRRGVSESKLFPARYCIENDRFARQAENSQARRDQLRAQWEVDPQSTCYVYVGKLIDKKHPLELLAAFATACRNGANAHLLVVGDGELRAKCEAIIKETRAPVTMTGFLNQSEIIDAYVASDCLVLPSDSGETWGLVTNEAMACGRPALVSDLAGCSRDLIVPKRTGEVLPFGDWQSWTDAIVRWSEKRDVLAEMGREAKQHIGNFTPEAAAEGIKQAVRFVSKGTK